jgi:hypothetical protein
MVRNDASIRIFVIVLCRAMPSAAFTAQAPNSAATQPRSAPVSFVLRPSSIARDSRYGGTARPTIHRLPSVAPAAIRRR